MIKEVILSADDFGRSHERNIAIDKAFKQGLIKSAALLINSEGTDEAIELAKNGGYFEHLHLHLNIISGNVSGNARPLDKKFAKDNVFCENGNFKSSRKYYGIQAKFNIFKAHSVYRELKKQAEKFIEISNELGVKVNPHIDFHLYVNLYLPVAIAMRRIIKRYSFKSARYIGIQHKNGELKWRIFTKLAMALCTDKNIKQFEAANIDYFLTKPEQFEGEIIELYTHPDMTDTIIMDNSISVFGNEKMPLEQNINSLKSKNLKFISWEDINS